MCQTSWHGTRKRKAFRAPENKSVPFQEISGGLSDSHLIEIGEREPATVDLNMLRRPM